MLSVQPQQHSEHRSSGDGSVSGHPVVIGCAFHNVLSKIHKVIECCMIETPRCKRVKVKSRTTKRSTTRDFHGSDKRLFVTVVLDFESTVAVAGR